MTDIDLDAIESRANAAGRTLTWFRACARYLFSYPPGIRPNEYLSLAASANDVPALIAAVRERDATLARVRDRIESVMASDDLDPDGYQVAGLISSVLRAEEGQ